MDDIYTFYYINIDGNTPTAVYGNLDDSEDCIDLVRSMQVAGTSAEVVKLAGETSESENNKYEDYQGARDAAKLFQKRSNKDGGVIQVVEAQLWMDRISEGKKFLNMNPEVQAVLKMIDAAIQGSNHDQACAELQTLKNEIIDNFSE